MDIIDRLNSFLNYTGLSSSQFADESQIPRPSLSQILNGRNKKISNEVINKLHDSFPMLNIMWLMFGEGEMINGETTPKNNETASVPRHFTSETDNALGANSGMKTDAAAMAYDLADSANLADSHNPNYSNVQPSEKIESIAADTFFTPEDELLNSLNVTGYGTASLRSTPPRTTNIKDSKKGYDPIKDNTTVDSGRNTPCRTDASLKGVEQPQRDISSIVVFYTDNTFKRFKPQ